MTKARDCDGKKAFTKAGAKAEAARRHKRFGANWTSAHPYKCPYCGQHHVGHSKKAKARRRR